MGSKPASKRNTRRRTKKPAKQVVIVNQSEAEEKLAVASQSQTPPAAETAPETETAVETEQVAEPVSSKRLTFIRKRRGALVAILGILLVAYGGFGLWQKYHTTHNTHPTIATKVLTSSTAHPDETPPPCDSYQVPATQPRRIIMPTIKASGCIEKVGTDKTGAVGVPNNVYLAGWYTPSVLPGSNGVSLIDGHVQGYYAPGIFKHLSGLKSGDNFQVEFGDRSLRSFQVVSVQAYSPEDVADKMLAQDPNITQQLNLITCGGPFDKDTKEYTQRILVVSKLIQS